MLLRPIAGSSTEPLNTIRDRWALLVGVNRYIEPAFPSLKFCVKDVLVLEVTLKELCRLADGADRPLSLVIASQKSLKDLFTDSPLRTSPLAGICQQIDVGPFSPDEARRFLKYRLEGTGVSFSKNQINELLAESGCHPGRLQRAAAELYHRLVMAS